MLNSVSGVFSVMTDSNVTLMIGYQLMTIVVQHARRRRQQIMVMRQKSVKSCDLIDVLNRRSGNRGRLRDISVGSCHEKLMEKFGMQNSSHG